MKHGSINVPGLQAPLPAQSVSKQRAADAAAQQPCAASPPLWRRIDAAAASITDRNGNGVWVLDSGFWVLDSGFWILDFAQSKTEKKRIQ